MKVIQGPLTEMDRVQRLMVRATRTWPLMQLCTFSASSACLRLDVATACLTAFAAV